MMKEITIAQVEHIAFKLARQWYTFSEPIPDFSTRYPNILESCILTPFQTYNKKDLYPTLLKKISILFYLMNKNHPFLNGNKRIAITTLLYVLFRNNKWITVKDTTLYNFAVDVASSFPHNKDKMLKYIESFVETFLSKY